MPHPARGILFDFDGVIADTEPLHEAALRAATQNLGISFTRQTYLARYVGFDDRECFATLFRDHSMPLDADRVQALIDLKWSFVREAINAGIVKPFPGAVELIRAAATARTTDQRTGRGQITGIAICSGATRREIIPILERFLGCSPNSPIWPFDAIITADDVLIAKPNPAGYILAAHRINVPPTQCITIEDTPKGIAAARAAGIQVIGVAHTVDEAQLMHAMGPQGAVIRAISDITLDWLLSRINS